MQKKQKRFLSLSFAYFTNMALRNSRLLADPNLENCNA